MTGPQIFEDIEQGTDEWRRIRSGIPTASSFAKLLAKGAGKTRNSYMIELAAEILTGEIVEGYSNADMDRGTALEPEARARYAFEHDAVVKQVGFIRNGDKGCSPDGLIDASGMLEIKCPRATTHITTLIENRVPTGYTAQVQGALWVAEREWIDFVSYCPGLPLFVRRVGRDETFISGLAGEVARFNSELAELVEKVRAMDRPAEAA